MRGTITVRALAALSSLMLVGGACTGTSSSVERDTQAIAALRQRIQDAENAGRAEEMAAVAAADVIVLPPNASPIRGATAFAEYLSSAFQSITMAVQYQSEEAVVSGDWAFDRGTYVSTVTPKAGGAGVREHGKYLWLVHRKADGAWQYARIMWNSDSAAVAAN